MREVDESHSDLAVFGAPQALTKPVDDGLFEIIEPNWPVAELFLRLSTQWVFAGMGGQIGLNYQSVQFLFTLYPTDDQQQLFEQLQFMESHALKALRERELNGGDRNSRP